ncbi:MAG TPA: hypothetical protein VK169_20520 [Saprospiraceae bacterium]|nr:hypothetical protein [Saprospiraceae bacterium]
MKKVKFLFHSLKNFQEMGTVVRSGSAMCRKMTQFITKEETVIVELGAGDGVITSYILKAMADDAKLFVFEINPELCEIISRIDDPRMILINDGAQNMDRHLHKHGISQVDSIISAIPFLVLPKDLTQEILLICRKNIKKGGTFIQMHYANGIKKMYEGIFGNVETYFVPMNIPPGYVFRCVKE